MQSTRALSEIIDTKEKQSRLHFKRRWRWLEQLCVARGGRGGGGKTGRLDHNWDERDSQIHWDGQQSLEPHIKCQIIFAERLIQLSPWRLR